MKDPFDSIEGVFRRSGIASDYANAWMGVVFYCNLLAEGENIQLPEGFHTQQVPMYADYILSRGSEVVSDREVLEASNPEKVRQLDELVSRFNIEFPELIENRSWQQVVEFWEQKVRPLIYEP